MNNRPATEKELSDSRIMACYHCDACREKGIVYFVQEGEIVCRPCHCMAIRGSILRAEASGIAGALGRCKFGGFQATEPWQVDAKRRVIEYAKNPQGWLYLFGQPGGGKTHLCTAAMGRLIHAGKEARYMLWKNEGTSLIGKINTPEYDRDLARLLSVQVLYIDDFLKTDRGENGKPSPPTTGHLNLAFQVINSRYINQKTTLISSEHSIDALIEYDEALGSRIYEMAKNNAILFPWGTKNNYRLNGGV